MITDIYLLSQEETIEDIAARKLVNIMTEAVREHEKPLPEVKIVLSEQLRVDIEALMKDPGDYEGTDEYSEFMDQIAVRQGMIRFLLVVPDDEVEAFVKKADKIIELAKYAGIFAAAGWYDEPEEDLDAVLEKARNAEKPSKIFNELKPPRMDAKSPFLAKVLFSKTSNK